MNTLLKGEQITWRVGDGEQRTGTVLDHFWLEHHLIGYYVSPDDRQSTQGLGAPSYPLLVSIKDVTPPE